MDRENAIEWFAMLKEKFVNTVYEKYLEMAIKALEQESKTGWIPVSERLPEDDEDILITYKGIMGIPITSVSYYDGDFRTEDGEGYFSEVIAWMPLPKPYKAETE